MHGKTVQRPARHRGRHAGPIVGHNEVISIGSAVSLDFELQWNIGPPVSDRIDPEIPQSLSQQAMAAPYCRIYGVDFEHADCGLDLRQQILVGKSDL